MTLIYEPVLMCVTQSSGSPELHHPRGRGSTLGSGQPMYPRTLHRTFHGEVVASGQYERTIRIHTIDDWDDFALYDKELFDLQRYVPEEWVVSDWDWLDGEDVYVFTPEAMA